MAFIEEDEIYDKLSKSLASAIKDTGEKTEFKEEEKEIISESKNRSMSEDIAQGLLDVFDKLVGTAGKVTDYVAEKLDIEVEPTELEIESKERLEKSKKRKQLLDESQVGGYAGSITEALVEPVLEGTALMRLGIQGEGVASIPITGTTWGASEYAIRRALGDTDEQAMDSAIMVGAIGKAFASIPVAGKGIAKAIEDGEEAMSKAAGGGKPPEFEDGYKVPEEDFKYFDDKFVEEAKDIDAKIQEVELRRDGFQEIDATQLREGKTNLLDTEIKTIQDKFNKLDESPEDIIIAENKDLFQGVDTLDAYAMLKSNTKLRDSLKKDIEDELFARMEKIDFIKRGDDRIEVGAKSDLYDMKDVDSTKAEQLAMDIQVKRAARMKLAETTKSQSIASRKLDYEKVVSELMPEVKKLYDEYKANPNQYTLFDLEESLRKVEPVKESIYKNPETGKTIGDIGDGFVETAETMSKTDIKVNESAVGMSTKGKPYTKTRLKQLEEQRKINEKKHQEFLDDNKDKIDRIKNKGYENEADKIEYEKLVEQDKKYRDTDKALEQQVELIPKEAKETTIMGFTEREFQRMKPSLAKAVKGMQKQVEGFKPLTKSQQKKLVEMRDELSGRKKYDGHKNKFLKNKHPQREKMKDSSMESSDIGASEADVLAKQSDVKRKTLETKKYDKDSADDIAEQDRVYQEELAREADEVFPVATKPQKKLVVKDTNPDVDKVGRKPKEIVEIENLEKRVESLRERAKKLFNETKTNWKASYRTDGDYKTYQKIHRQTRDALNVAAKAGADTQEYLHDLFKAEGVSKGGEFDKGFAKYVLGTDYVSIRGMSKADAMKYMNKHKTTYTTARKYIEQTAKGIKDKGHMNHIDFTNNGYQIAQRAGLDPVKYGDIIDKLVSIRAMDNEAWGFIEVNGSKNLFDKMMNIADTLKKESDTLFKDNPHAQVKGYMAETYDSIYRYEMKDGEFKKFIDAEVGMVQGGLPQKLDNARTGEVRQFPKGVENLSDSAKLDYAEVHNLGVVLNQYAQPVAMRKVASEAQRLSIGKSANASDMIPLTFENNVRKMVQKDTVIQDILDTKDNTLFSSVKKEGMVQLSDEELKSIPRELRTKVQYVSKDFKHMLLGNKQIQVAEKQWSKITEQLLKDTVSHFKENVVLKNPASWANNMGYNFFVNMQEGISPMKTISNMKRGLKEKARAEELVTKLTRLELDGKSGTKEYTNIEKELSNNLYYNMDRQGLAVTVMSNIMDSPIASKRLSDKMMKQGLRAVLKNDKAVDKVVAIVSNLYLSPQSKAGQAAMNMFGSIDAMGRYSLALETMKKSSSLDDAIKKANGIYGDLDMIAPMWSQAIQHYGFIPFSNWYFRMSGGLAKSILDNKFKALGVAALLYGISEATDKRTDSMNPLVSLVETPADMLVMSPYFNISNYARNVTTPAVYKKGYRAIESGDPLSVALTRDF